MIQYNFPATKFVRENSSGEQLFHFFSEVREIKEAIGAGEPQERIREEIYDALHSLETWVRMQERERGTPQVELEMDGIYVKNDERGYYE